MNIVILDGRLTKEPELKQTAKGESSLSFTLASQKPYKDDNGEYGVDFVLCNAFRQRAEFIAAHFHKGDGIQIEGRIETYHYQDVDGIDRLAITVRVSNVGFPLTMPSHSGNGKKEETRSYVPDANFPSEEEALQSLAEDDLPF